MNHTEENMNGKPVFVITEKPDVIQGQPEGEVPVITIERDDDDNEASQPAGRQHRILTWIGASVVTMILCLLIAVGYRYYIRHIYIGVPVSVTSAENIARLQQPAAQVRPEVIMSSDSILGVALNLYELRGLKAEISFDEPDTTDTDVYLYSRSADFTSYDPATNEYIGSMVKDGKVLSSDNSRIGYCAMADGNVVIGVARDEKVMDYCVERHGCFFRQFVLVSRSQLPPRFYLHGKVERRAIGRIDNRLYYIESVHKEGMYEFADAIREYGFADAIYITGGTDYSYYRDAEGTCHGIGDKSKYKGKHKGEGIVPWIVFRRR